MRLFLLGMLTWLAVGGVAFGVWSLGHAAWEGLAGGPTVLYGCYVNGVKVSCDDLLGERQPR
jgi:hypothetical protein